MQKPICYATGAACQQRTLTPPDTWSCPTLGLACVLISPELVLSPDFWISNTLGTSLLLINVAFGYEKNNPVRRAGEKITLLPFCPKKIFLARTKNPSPPPEYQMDRALHHPFWLYLDLALLGHHFTILKPLSLAKDHWWGFSTHNAHMIHIVNWIDLTWCIHLSWSLFSYFDNRISYMWKLLFFVHNVLRQAVVDRKRYFLILEIHFLI